MLSPASARHRHHWHHQRHTSALEIRTPAASQQPDGLAGQSVEENPGAPAARPAIPPGWTEQPSGSKTGGKRFASPEGRAWVETSTTDVAAEPVSAHMRSVAFGDGETLTFIRGESDRIEVAGVKGDRHFYRKAIIACAGRVWHQIAMEYPVDMSRHIQPLLKSIPGAVDASETLGCGDNATPSAATTGSGPAR
jgi:hypothetical protein